MLGCCEQVSAWALFHANATGVELTAEQEVCRGEVRLHVFLGFFLPMLYPQDRSVFTTLGRTAAVSGTRTKMKDLWTMYARPS